MSLFYRNCHFVHRDSMQIQNLVHPAPRAKVLNDFLRGGRWDKSRRVVKPSIYIRLVARSVAYGALYRLSAQAYMVYGHSEKFIGVD